MQTKNNKNINNNNNNNKNINVLKSVHCIMVFEHGKYKFTMPVVFDTIAQRDMYVELYSLKDRAAMAKQQLVFATFNHFANYQN